MENPKALNVDGRSELCVKRVKAPVLDCTVMTQLTRLWHVSLSLRMENGVDDFYPRAQLHKLLERCGKPELAPVI